MTVSIKFEAGQQYQLEAIDAVTSLFTGWNASASSGVVDDALNLGETDLFMETVFGNQLGISDEELIANAKLSQTRTRLNSVGEEQEVIPQASRLPIDHAAPIRDISIEMETGTGKTYVYLRTAIELYLKYNLSKFVIVVPTVAIREGVLASLELLKEHFRELYAGLQYDSYVYDSKYINRLRQFATSKHLQILVMNIQSFNKDSNIILREADNLNGMKPMDFITAVKPIVIMDEPQKLDAKLQKEAIAALNPLFRLRYSATHKVPHCLVYRLGPVEAYEQRLVKRIEVLSMSAEEDHNIAYIEVRKINLQGGGKPTASILLNRGGKRVNQTLKFNDDLFAMTGMSVYKGWEVEDVVADTPERKGYVEFRNHRKVFVNSNNDLDQDWWQRAQIQATIEKHFETELRLHQSAALGEIQPTKALTLFFIDKVSNYDPEDGKFKVWFDELYTEMLKSSEYRRFKNLQMPPAAEARAGYFATTRGKAKDTKGDSNDDSDVYDLIMRDKERLLSPDEPVRFIFSHSALSEGWDNPNVFTICNLQETQSEVRRRQQIGRGLRLPVMANGERSRNDRINILTVVASESFEKYAAGLQKEMTDETGESFSGTIVNARTRRIVKLRENYELLPGFKDLWNRIAPRTRYELSYNSQDLVDEASMRLTLMGSQEPIKTPKIVIKKTHVEMGLANGVTAGTSGPEKAITYDRSVRVPDILKELQSELPVSRSTIAVIIQRSGRLKEVLINPAQFMNQVRRSIQGSLSQTLVKKDGIKYSPIVGEGSKFAATFMDTESYEDNLVSVKKSIYEAVVVDSNIERDFAVALDGRDDVELFIKLPDWFKIPTPIGNYNPDWAVVLKLETGEKKVYLVRETKGSTELESLRFETEPWKIYFGFKHFTALEVDYNVNSRANQLNTGIPISFNFG